MKSFRTYKLAVEFYQEAGKLSLPKHLKDQLLRASASIALNLAEGDGRQSTADRRRFFTIAYGSMKECEAILALTTASRKEVLELIDKLGAHLYRLISNVR